MQLHMLSTLDNPFNPFTKFDEWNAYDMALGYHTLAYLDRITITSDGLSEADRDLALEYAIDEIIKENLLGIYVKVQQP